MSAPDATTRILLLAALVGPTLPAAASAGESIVPLEGDVPPGAPDHFFVPFEVPEGVAEIEVRDTRGDRTNVLDHGVDDPAGYRGWGGGTSEPTVIGLRAASRAYVPGPLPRGTWRVVVGKARVTATPARYAFEVVLRDAPTLPDQTDRTAYAAPAPIRKERRWYAGDFHVHSRESTDADKVLDEMLPYARSRGLDFIVVTDHNTITQLDYFGALQAKTPDVLLVPGNEVTTYQGHAGAIGTTRWIDHRVGQPGVTIDTIIDATHAGGGLFSVNHPVIELGQLCIGCAWKHDNAPARVDAVEIQNIGIDDGTGFYLRGALAFWEDYLERGSHAAALGGSDDHSAGTSASYGQFASPIGSPLTLVLADELSPAAIVDGVRRGRTVVKLQGPADPMAELESEVPPDAAATVAARSTRLRVKVTAGPTGGPPIGGGGAGGGDGPRSIRFVKNGVALEEIAAAAEPFETTLDAIAPESGEDRYRVEVLRDGRVRTITSHLFVKKDPAGPDPVAAGRGASDDGCALRPGDRTSPAWAVISLVGLALARRRRATRR